jgi:hypothetical protein
MNRHGKQNIFLIRELLDRFGQDATSSISVIANPFAVFVNGEIVARFSNFACACSTADFHIDEIIASTRSDISHPRRKDAQYYAVEIVEVRDETAGLKYRRVGRDWELKRSFEKFGKGAM